MRTAVADDIDPAGEPEAIPCGTCRRDLAEDERNTCRRCVGKARADLHAIVNAYAMLPDIIGNPLGSNAPKWRNDSGHTKAATYPMPGGEALVLAAGGGDGRGQLWADHYGLDDQAEDPPSVAAALGMWEDDFRRIRREPAALSKHYVASAAAYLLEHTGWAGSRHPDFPEFAADLKRLRAHLERATGTDDPIVRSGAPCLSCDPPAPRLERRYGVNGLEDDWSCPRCRRTYTPDEHMDAVRTSARLQRLAEYEAQQKETPA